MRNLFVFLAGVLLSCSAFALFSRATWGEPIGVDSLEPVLVQGNAAVQEEVRARRFVLVNEKGISMGVFDTFGGQPCLMLHGENKKVRAIFGLDKDAQPGVALFDKNGKIRAQFDIEGNEPRVVLFDENGKIRARFGTEGNEPGLVLLDKDGKATFQVPQ